MDQLTIVSSCGGDYSRYLAEWASSIDDLTTRPGAVRLFTHGDEVCRIQGALAIGILHDRGIDARHEHESSLLDFGTARNRAVAMSSTEWVMHLDCDDTIMPHAVEDIAKIAPDADVVAMGYERSGDLASGPANRKRLYSDTTGLKALDAAAPCSGVSPFRRSFWERSPYRTDMLGAWDTALWIGFARLGARFRATKRPCFWYRQHADSVFNKRRTTFDWTHAKTVAQLKALRRGDAGVAFIVPRDEKPPDDRAQAWEYVRARMAKDFPNWPIVSGLSPARAWSKGAAIAAALDRCTAKILVIADADCLVPREAIQWAVDQVEAGEPWAVPHTRVLRLNRTRTRSILDENIQEIIPDESRDLARPVYEGFAGGGILVVSRIAYEATGGIPPSFRGWGGEDQALAVILDCLVGPHVRGKWDLLHLWHEPQMSKRLGTGNQFRFQSLARAAREGRDKLLDALRDHGNPAKPWLNGYHAPPALTRRERQNFLLRRQRGNQ